MRFGSISTRYSFVYLFIIFVTICFLETTNLQTQWMILLKENTYALKEIRSKKMPPPKKNKEKRLYSREHWRIFIIYWSVLCLNCLIICHMSRLPCPHLHLQTKTPLNHHRLGSSQVYYEQYGG